MIIIPARLHSTRFPQKMLTDILGKPMIVRSAQVAQEVDDVIVATDSQEILEICARHDIKAILTLPTHTSGTDRCAEAARILGLEKDEIVINMQGDEPFLESCILEKLRQIMQSNRPFMATCIKDISALEAQDPNVVKVVLDSSDCALYFSRSVIPYNRDLQEKSAYYGHLGIYGFTYESLQEFCTLPKSPLEEIEKLEQLRALWNQKQIQTILVQTQSIGIDTQEDKMKAIEHYLDYVQKH